MAEGRNFAIPQPDFLAMSPSGRTVMVFYQDDSWSIVDLLLMTELDFSPTSNSAA